MLIAPTMVIVRSFIVLPFDLVVAHGTSPLDLIRRARVAFRVRLGAPIP